LGFAETLSRYLPKKKNSSELITSTFFISLLFALFFSITITIFIFNNFTVISFIGYLTILNQILLLTIGNTLTRLERSVFAGLSISKNVLLITILINLLRLVFLIISYVLKLGIIFAHAISFIVGSLIGIYLITKKIDKFKISFSLNFKELKPLWKYTFSSYIARIFEDLPSALLPYIVLISKSEEESAYFFIPWAILGIYLQSIRMLSTSFLVEGSRDENNLWSTFFKTIIIAIVLGIIFMLMLLFLGQFILSFYGITYLINSFELLKILSFSSIFIGINRVYYDYLRIKNKLWMATIIQFVISFGTIIGSYLLIQYQPIELIGVSWLIINFCVTLIALIHIISNKIKSKSYH